MKISTRVHTGKIGRLPKEIRNQLAHGINDGIPGVRLVAWLNSLPEVQAILQSDFGGQPIKEQNLSKWKARGYSDWLEQQAFLEATLTMLGQNSQRLGLAPSPSSANEMPL